MEITGPEQVGAPDITDILMAKGFLYLVAIIDWHTRYVVAWRLYNTLDADFCVDALGQALSKGRPVDVTRQVVPARYMSEALAAFQARSTSPSRVPTDGN